jgi:hypothetical protein
MAKQATDAQIETAIEVLRAYDGTVEQENQRDVDAVIAWLDDLIAQRMIRAEARRAGVPTAKLRAKLAEQTGCDR